jgi:DNA-binding PadR family transcriptional regulator
MEIQSVLLGFLMRESMTGYELRKKFSLSFSFFSGLSYGSIYPALKKMERQGFVSKRLEIQDGAPNRKVYTITEAGKQHFLDSLRAPFSPEQPKNTFLMRLFFFQDLSGEERSVIALSYLESIEQISARLEAIGPEIEMRADRFQYLCFEFGVRFFNDLQRNLSHVVDALEEERTEAR